jgi:hypothetical protein
VPYIKQDEPLKLECQHFLECIRGEASPITGGRQGLEVVRILEAAGKSLHQKGSAVNLGTVPVLLPSDEPVLNGNGSANGNGNGNGKSHNGNGNGHGVLVPAEGRSVLAA